MATVYVKDKIATIIARNSDKGLVEYTNDKLIEGIKKDFNIEVK